MKFRRTIYNLIIFSVIICMLFAGCKREENDTPSTPHFTLPTITPPTTEIDNSMRKNYGVGSCYDMKESICYLIIFLDDKESSWSEEDKLKFMEKKFEPSLSFLHEKAESYNVTLNDKYLVYEKEDKSAVTYSQVIDADIVENGSQDGILSAVASSLGYPSVRSMNLNLKKDLEVDQVAYLIVLNKKGRSYKHSHQINSTEKYEFCVFFNDTILYKDGNCTSTIAHEILHLFGAEDYYDPYGEFPKREKLAKELYPNDIMNETFKNINDAEIGNFTAYTVGWIDEMPAECDVPEWWE